MNAAALRLAVTCSVLLCAAAVLGVAHAAPAAARCIPLDQRTPSPYAFTGTVVSTRTDGRIATVETAEGRTVEVHGGPDTRVATTVDRTFEDGVTYEFHPANDASPYRVSACTLTRVVDAGPFSEYSRGEEMPVIRIYGPSLGERLSPLLLGERLFPLLRPMFPWAAGGLVVGGVLCAASLMLWRRRRRPGTDPAA